MMIKEGLLMTRDKEADAKEIVSTLNKELRHRGLSDEYYVKYYTHKLTHGVTFAIYYIKKRKEVNE